MKIVHFISGIKSGGVEQFLFNYTKSINKNFPVKEYIVYQHEPNIESLRKLQMAGNKCIKIADKAHRPIKNLIQSFQLIRKIKPDIVHAHMNLVNFFPLFVAFILKVPVRINHSHIASDNIDMKIAIPIFKKLNLFFSNARFACGALAGKYMYGNRKYQIIRNAINVNHYLFDVKLRNEYRKKFGVPQGFIVFGNIGRLTKQKNQLFLIKIFKELHKRKPNAILFILGSGELKYSEIKLIKSLKLEKFIHIISPVEDTAPFYNMIDVFLLPSLYEGFPIVSIEAQISGLPLIMTDTIDKSAKLLNSTYFLPKNNFYSWVSEMNIITTNCNRIIDKKKFECFDIHHCSLFLIAQYVQLLKKYKN